MRRRRPMALPAVAAVALAAATTAAAPSRDLPLAERIAAQAAIERVHYGHQEGAKGPFERAVSTEALEGKVRTYLLKSAALEKHWRTSVTAPMLQAELARIARDTRLPGRLQEIYATLGGDAFLVRECLARPVLVDRLARSFHAYDRRIHRAAAEEAEELRRQLVAGTLDASAPRAGGRVVEFARADAAVVVLEPRSPAAAAAERIELAPADYRRARGRAPRAVGDVGPVVEERDAFTVTVLIADEPPRFRIALHSVAKATWDAWWAEAAAALDVSTVRVAAGAEVTDRLPLPGRAAGEGTGLAGTGPTRAETGATTCVPDGTWASDVMDLVLDARDGHTAVWTGTEMIVWGGSGASGLLQTGHRYDPLTDAWRPVALELAPSPRFEHTAVWTGHEMIVWGGRGGPGEILAAGGRYNPLADVWRPVAPLGAPAARRGHVAAWAGGRMIVWGGRDGAGVRGDGGRYNPQTDTWAPTSLTGAPAARHAATAVAAGARLIVWGGVGEGPESTASPGEEQQLRGDEAALIPTPELDSGGIYDPAIDLWTPTAGLAAPAARQDHSAVWTGSAMVIWGGRSGGANLATGGVYDPASDAWTATSTTGAPEARVDHAAAWTGSTMVVWGGASTFSALASGGRYDPAANTWSPTATTSGVNSSSGATAIWTGGHVVFWGGTNGWDGKLRTGLRYDPVADAWTPTAVAPAPARSSHSAIWTGTEMIVWGGSTTAHLTGDRYDPLVDSWTATAASPVPGTEVAVWTGSEMIVWGSSSYSNGARYNPFTDAWTPTSTVGAPGPRYGTTAVWTGTEMIVWGGAYLDTGGRYDPALDAWRPTSTVNAPLGRRYQTAVWTGDRMVIWGGYTFQGDVDTGGRYDPVADAWEPTSLDGAPNPMTGHTAVWTGTEMIVWGGVPVIGGRYDPVLDSWAPMAGGPDEPLPRWRHNAVWTGRRMVVWGGIVEPDWALTSTGGTYDPIADDWAATALAGAPEAKESHSAVWGAGLMLVWGGVVGGVNTATGGGYFLGHYDDIDGDGFAVCDDGDCDDFEPATHPGAPEACDGVDNDCDGAPLAAEADADADGFRVCAGDCDDGDAASFPGYLEFCDGRDNDCDGAIDGFATLCGVGECVATGLCAGGVDSCVPDAPTPEGCDGLDNDCNGLVPTGESDGDADGSRICAGDCDDSDPTVHPAAPEMNDGIDNQCTGGVGYGLVDEISGSAGFSNPLDPVAFCWPPQEGAGGYEVIRSPSPDFAANCARERTSSTCWRDPEAPPASAVWHYLVQSISPYVGSLGARSDGQERLALCGVENDCDDGLDEDGDGAADCEDVADCFGKGGCVSRTFAFVDGPGDDGAPAALAEFLAPITALPTHYFRLSLSGSGVVDLAWCAERADFYRDAYLAFAEAGGMATSGPWRRWTRVEGGAWTGPDEGLYDNLYGEACFRPWVWCSEVDLGWGRSLGIDPVDVGYCEAHDNLACGYGNWTLAITIGVDRLSACGF